MTKWHEIFKTQKTLNSCHLVQMIVTSNLFMSEHYLNGFKIKLFYFWLYELFTPQLFAPGNVRG
jgi:hypothetical protein